MGVHCWFSAPCYKAREKNVKFAFEFAGMFFFRKASYQNWAAMAMAIFLVNVSIDPPDPGRAQGQEDISVNEIESIVELALETFFGIDNIVPEGDDGDQEANLQFMGFAFNPERVGLVSLNAYRPLQEVNNFCSPQSDLAEGTGKVSSPPPKLA